MNTFSVIIALLVAWTVASILYVVTQLGYKNRRYRGWRKVVDIVLGSPALVIAIIFGRLRKRDVQ